MMRETPRNPSEKLRLAITIEMFSCKVLFNTIIANVRKLIMITNNDGMPTMNIVEIVTVDPVIFEASPVESVIFSILILINLDLNLFKENLLF